MVKIIFYNKTELFVNDTFARITEKMAKAMSPHAFIELLTADSKSYECDIAIRYSDIARVEEITEKDE